MFSISNENKSIFIKNKDILNPLHAMYIKNDWEDILLKNIKLYGNYSPKKIISESINNNIKIIDYAKLKEEFIESLFDINNLSDLKKAKGIITRKGHAIRPDIRPEGV